MSAIKMVKKKRCRHYKSSFLQKNGHCIAECTVKLVYKRHTTEHENMPFMRSYPLLVHLDQRSRWTIAITWCPSSVVYKLFTFQASSPKPLGQLEPNLVWMFLGWSSTNFLFFVPVRYSTWLSGPIICSWLVEISKIFSETNELTEPKL